MTFEEACASARERKSTVVARDRRSGNVVGMWDERAFVAAALFRADARDTVEWEVSDVPPGEGLAMIVGAKKAPKA